MSSMGRPKIRLTGLIVDCVWAQIPEGHSRDEFDMILPPQGQSPSVTSVAITRHFIVTSSKQGVIAYYLAKVSNQ